jgi:hypothetical protein
MTVRSYSFPFRASISPFRRHKKRTRGSREALPAEPRRPARAAAGPRRPGPMPRPDEDLAGQNPGSGRSWGRGAAGTATGTGVRPPRSSRGAGNRQKEAPPCSRSPPGSSRRQTLGAGQGAAAPAPAGPAGRGGERGPPPESSGPDSDLTMVRALVGRTRAPELGLGQGRGAPAALDLLPP